MAYPMRACQTHPLDPKRAIKPGLAANRRLDRIGSLGMRDFRRGKSLLTAFSARILRFRCAVFGGAPPLSHWPIAKSELLIGPSDHLAAFDDTYVSQRIGVMA
jgi:hypothetical protein